MSTTRIAILKKGRPKGKIACPKQMILEKKLDYKLFEKTVREWVEREWAEKGDLARDSILNKLGMDINMNPSTARITDSCAFYAAALGDNTGINIIANIVADKYNINASDLMENFKSKANTVLTKALGNIEQSLHDKIFVLNRKSNYPKEIPYDDLMANYNKIFGKLPKKQKPIVKIAKTSVKVAKPVRESTYAKVKMYLKSREAQDSELQPRVKPTKELAFLLQPNFSFLGKRPENPTQESSTAKKSRMGAKK